MSALAQSSSCCRIVGIARRHALDLHIGQPRDALPVGATLDAVRRPPVSSSHVPRIRLTSSLYVLIFSNCEIQRMDGLGPMEQVVPKAREERTTRKASPVSCKTTGRGLLGPLRGLASARGEWPRVRHSRGTPPPLFANEYPARGPARRGTNFSSN
jgi:hypothetical protein